MSYKAFRSNYPQASLITELLQIDHGYYIVRCLVQELGITLCCGLSADRSVEIAENNAIERALTLLAVRNDSGSKSLIIKKAEDWDIKNKNAKDKDIFIAPPVESKKSLEDITVEDILKEASESLIEVLPEVEELSEDFTEPVEPMDFSQIIARTNQELKRLGWTSQQGKEHLMQKYGKRSRQLLTDDELRDFLSFLETESTPPGLF